MDLGGLRRRRDLSGPDGPHRLVGEPAAPTSARRTVAERGVELAGDDRQSVCPAARSAVVSPTHTSGVSACLSAAVTFRRTISSVSLRARDARSECPRRTSRAPGVPDLRRGTRFPCKAPAALPVRVLGADEDRRAPASTSAHRAPAPVAGGRHGDADLRPGRGSRREWPPRAAAPRRASCASSSCRRSPGCAAACRPPSGQLTRRPGQPRPAACDPRGTRETPPPPVRQIAHAVGDPGEPGRRRPCRRLLTTDRPGASATARASPSVPAANGGRSKTPIGPFQTMVRLSRSASAKWRTVAGPMSSPMRSAGIASARDDLALRGVGRVGNRPCRRAAGGRTRAPAPRRARRRAVSTQVRLEERPPNLVALGAEERERHPAADQEPVDPAQERLDQRELVGDLRRRRGSRRAGRAGASKIRARRGELLPHEEPRHRGPEVPRDAFGRGVGPVGRRERVVHVDVAEPGERLWQTRARWPPHPRGSGGSRAGACRPAAGALRRTLGGRPDAVRREGNGFAEERPRGAARSGASEYFGSGPPFGRPRWRPRTIARAPSGPRRAQRRERGADAGVLAHLAVAPERDVEVDAHEQRGGPERRDPRSCAWTWRGWRRRAGPGRPGVRSLPGPTHEG